MNYRYCILAALIIVPSNLAAQQWGNPENQMLNNTMTDFFYYATKDPVPFSDPNSLDSANRNARIYDTYYDELDAAREYAERQRVIQNFLIQQQYNDYYYRRYRSFRY